MTMRCPAGVDVVDIAVRDLQQIRPSGDRPRIVAVTGFPYAGKTRFADELAAAWHTGRAVVLPTESAVLPRQRRREAGIDGCAPAGHDLDQLVSYVDSLRSGRAVALPTYSWDVGDHVGTSVLTGVRERDLLIIDGTVAASSRVAGYCDLVIFLSPTDPEQWLHLATERDVAERAWPDDAAVVENRKKYQTSLDLGTHFAPADHLLRVAVDPAAWTARLAGCAFCETASLRGDVDVSGPGQFDAEAPISEARCQLGQ